ncbi:MAG: c-type cytochrome biogenesis protein CcsB [Actinomycetota bacterium]|jgi:cytochrome c-type biogenesis protein CcsB|nr:c-type cytochrome biogenesis protein CcsB [Actinomycetota bacterium]
MTDQSLAQASNVALYVTMGVLTLAMLAFAVHLAVQGSRVPRHERARRAEQVSVGAGGVDTLERAADPDPPAAPASRRWGVIGVQLTWLATFTLVACIAMRGLSVQRAPLGNMYEFALVAAAFTLFVYASWSLRSDRTWLGLFVVTPVLLILGLALVVWYTEASQLLPSLDDRFWLVIHVTVATLSTALFTIGAVLAGLYLVRDRAERATGQPTGWLSALPRAAVLERTAYAVHIIAFPLWTFTLIAGAIWAEQAWGRYWGWDPKEVWTFVVWVVYVAYLHARATTGWTTRKATWLAIAGYGCILINFGVVNVFLVGMHSYSGL